MTSIPTSKMFPPVFSSWCCPILHREMAGANWELRFLPLYPYRRYPPSVDGMEISRVSLLLRPKLFWRQKSELCIRCELCVFWGFDRSLFKVVRGYPGESKDGFLVWKLDVTSIKALLILSCSPYLAPSGELGQLEFSCRPLIDIVY